MWLPRNSAVRSHQENPEVHEMQDLTYSYSRYWDEQLDQGIDLNHSPIFDPVTGFGQNGQGDNHCVLDGPFANLTLHVSGDGPQDYCLSREFDPDSFTLGNITYVEECMSMQNYSSAFPCWFLNPHIAGHWGVGGTVSLLTRDRRSDKRGRC